MRIASFISGVVLGTVVVLAAKSKKGEEIRHDLKEEAEMLFNEGYTKYKNKKK